MVQAIRTIIMAAGKGTRMKSDLPKVLHQVNGKPMIQYVIEQAQAVNSEEIYIVVGYGKELVKQQVNQYKFLPKITFVEQLEQLGTGHAVSQVIPYLIDYEGLVLVLSGDVPLTKPSTLKSLFFPFLDNIPSASILTNRGVSDPSGCGRIIRTLGGEFLEIVEEKDIDNEETRQINEVNTGIYVFWAPDLVTVLPLINNQNKQGEYYLPDALRILRQQKKNIVCISMNNSTETMGVNDLEQLREAEFQLNKIDHYKN